MTRVLQVVTDTDRRGGQLFATDLERELCALGHVVTTVALAPGRTGGLGHRVLGGRRLGAATLGALRQALQGVDVAIAHGSSTLPACAIAGLGTQTPFVYRQISESLFWANTRARRARVRWGLSRARHVVALWSGSAETLTASFGVPPDRISVIPNAVRTEFFSPVTTARRERARTSFGLRADLPVVLYVGALAPEKGVDLAIEAQAHLEDAQLLVVGEGPERARLEVEASRRAAGRVVFTGSLPSALDAYAAADVVVLPSRGGDSMPAVLIEAGATGLPAVATAVEGIPDIIVDEMTGSLVDPDPRSIARALLRYLHDPDLARSVGAAARVRCMERFSFDRVAAQWSQVVDSCARSVGQRGRRAR